jgi:hypothetical protein
MRQCPTLSSPLPYQPSHPVILSSTNKLALILMFHAHSTAASTSTSASNFQLIINDALNTYKKRTKNDLLAHPLAAQLQSCDSPSAILAVLQQQVQGLDQSQNSDDRWTKWLDPTVNVIYAFSTTIGAGVSLVCFRDFSEVGSLIFMWQLFSPASVIFAGVGVLLSVCIPVNFAWATVTHSPLRQLKMFEQVKTLSLTSLSALKCFSDVSRSTQKYGRLRK